jgi:hypothetical protein
VQLGESGKYWMKRVRVVYFHIRSSECGNPHLYQLKTDRLIPMSKFDYVLTHAEFMGSHKLSSFDDRRVRQYLTSPAVMYTEIVYGPPTDSPNCGIVWKMCARES